MGRAPAFVVCFVWLAVSQACVVPELVSQSTLLPLPGAGPLPSDHGTFGAHASATARTTRYGSSAGLPPTDSASYVPRAQLEGDLWFRPGRNWTLSVPFLVGLHDGSEALVPTGLGLPAQAPWAVGLSATGDVPVDDENRFSVSVRALVGSAGSITTYRTRRDDVACLGCSPPPPPSYSYETRQELLVFGSLGATGVWAHRLGPLRTLVLAGLANQPTNGAIGGPEASLSLGRAVFLVGAGLELSIADWLGVSVLVVEPLGAAPFDYAPMLSFGVSFTGDRSRDDGPPDALAR